jgi:IclR family KDG regulon transcriptional repressor
MTLSADVADVAPERHDTVSSVCKAVRVLRSLAQVGEDADGVTRIAAAANLPKSTTHRILSAFVNEGLVCRSGSLYRLDQRWYDLHTPPPKHEWQRLLEQSRRGLARLFEQSRVTVHFAVIDGDDVVVLDKLTARGGASISTCVGGRYPALCTAAGKVIVAHRSRTEMRQALCRPLPVLTERSIRTVGVMANQLSEARRCGVGYAHEEVQSGVFCVAAPILVRGCAVAAVSLSRFGGRGTNRADAVAVRQAASEISRRLEHGD